MNIGNPTITKLPSVKRQFVKILVVVVVLIATLPFNLWAKYQTTYGRIYNVQDFINTAPTGLSITQETIGFQRCFTNVMEDIYQRCLIDSNPKIYTILIPLKKDPSTNSNTPYQINERLSAVKIKISNSGPTKTFKWLRPLNNSLTKITINIIGLRIYDSVLKVAMLDSALQANNTQLNYVYNSQNPLNENFYIPTYYMNNGLISTPAFDNFLNNTNVTYTIPFVDVNMQCNGNPSNTNFLNYYSSATMPIIESTNPLSHDFIFIETDDTSTTAKDAYQTNPIGKINKMFNNEVNICGLNLRGVNSAKNTNIYDKNSAQHNETFKMGMGILLRNINSVFIDNMIIENFYGNGIMVNNRFNAYVNGSVNVSKNVIKNVWGLKYKELCNKTYDDTGDGIQFIGINNGISNYNYIYNDLAVTKQYGRIGLATCSEHNRNTTAKYNVVHGYDRGIHSENNLSGFNITKNRITGSETGIVFDGNRDYKIGTSGGFCPLPNPSTIDSNYISNEGIIFNPYLQKIYPPHLLFAALNFGTLEYWGTSIKNNELVIDNNFVFKYSRNNINYSCPDDDPRPWQNVDDMNRYHIHSGIYAQEIKCNLLRVKNNKKVPYRVGGVNLRSWCENLTTLVCQNPPPNNFTDCTDNNDIANTVPIQIQGNVLINCDQLLFIHSTSSLPFIYSNILNNRNNIVNSGLPLVNAFVNNQPNFSSCVSYEKNEELISWSNMGCESSSGFIDASMLTSDYNISCTPTISVTPTQVAGIYEITQPGIYTLVATNMANPNMTITKTIPIYQTTPEHCCNKELATTKEIIPISSTNTSGLISLIGGTSSISNKSFYIDGTYSINISTTFDNCQFYFTPHAKIKLLNSSILTMNKCSLLASCDSLWDGIYADNSTQKNVLNNSILQDMMDGIFVSNGAKLICENNMFTNNYISMQIDKAPQNYSSIQNNYGAVVLDNKFNSTGHKLLKPYATLIKSQHGIVIANCKDIRIGDLDVDKPNMFEFIYNGMYIYNSLINTQNKVWAHNNSFFRIHGDDIGPNTENTILTNLYTSFKGAGIFICNYKSIAARADQKINLFVKSKNNTQYFTKCDKAIVGNNTSIDVIDYNIIDCLTGITANVAHAQDYNIFHNRIENTILGIQLVGNLNKANIQNHSSADNCGIFLREVGGNWLPTPIGIDVQYSNSIHNGVTTILNNDFEIKGKKGTAIRTHLTGNKLGIFNNTINFTTLDESGANANVATLNYLRGIYVQNSDGNKVNCNLVNGLSTQAVFNKRHSQAISMQRSPNCEVSCNNVNNSWFGISAYGNCATTEQSIKSNTMSNHIYGLATFPGIFSDEGDVGNIGLANYDNNNVFNGSYFNQGNYKTLRYWGNQNNINSRTINTNQPINSTSNYIGGEYQIAQASNPQNCQSYFNCLNNDNTAQVIPNIDEGIAMDIAQDSIMYYANPQVSQWVAKYELFTNLEKDSILRVNNAILNTFYQTQQAQSIGQVRTTEQKLNLITDSLVYYDSLQFTTKINDAITSNNAITGSENYLVNERWTNALWIKIMMYGYDTLDANEITDLETLAKSCPAVEGLSVYKARMLYTYYEPLFDYDDYDLCSNASKGVAGMYDSLLYFLQNPNQVPEKKNTMGINQLLVYPNPAGKDINIAYNFEGDEDAVFQLFDVLGRMPLQTTLPNNLNQIQLHLNSLHPGFYSYRATSGKQQFYGKLLIQ